MKYLIISDIHGDYYYLNKILEYKSIDKWDKIICLGDLLYHGPRNTLIDTYDPMKVVSILEKYKYDFIWIKGNCDAEIDETVMQINYINDYKLNINNISINFVHGDKLNFDTDYKNNDYIIHGHYHRYNDLFSNNRHYINIGSTSLPKDNINQYGLLDEETNIIEVYDTDHNLLHSINIK